jgi:hypothetical protein
VLAFQERLTLCCGGGVPLPVSGICMVEFVALLTKEAPAEAAPLVCGVKVTVNEADWPGGIVTGSEGPPTANSEVLAVAEETNTLDPVALRVAFMELLWPTTTFPKFKVLGLTPN